MDVKLETFWQASNRRRPYEMWEGQRILTQSVQKKTS